MDQEFEEKLAIEKSKYQHKLKVAKKLFWDKITEVRTEMARKEIKHQEELLLVSKHIKNQLLNSDSTLNNPSSNDPLLKNSTYSLKYYEEEIQKLKRELQASKEDLRRKDHIIEEMRNEKVMGTKNLIDEIGHKYIEFKEVCKGYEEEVEILKQKLDVEIRNNDELYKCLQEIIDESRIGNVISEKDAQINSLNQELNSLKVRFATIIYK